MIANGNTYCRVITPILPPEYQEVEYIESDGNQYIETNVIADQDTSINVRFKLKSITNLTESSGSCVYSGAASYNNRTKEVYSNANKLSISCGNAYVYSSLTINTNDIFEIENTKNIYIVKNVNTSISSTVKHTYTTYTTPYSIWLFALHRGNSMSSIKGKGALIYKCSILQDTTLVRNFIPCYRKSDSVIGMYDTVNKVFYTNQGTGTFLKGNNVVHTIRYKIPTEERPYISGHVTDGSSTFTFNVNNQDITVPVNSDGNWKWYVDRTITSFQDSFKQKSNIEKLFIYDKLNDCTSLYGMFTDASALQEVEFRNAIFNKVTTTAYMLNRAYALTKLKLPNAQFDSLITVSNMFIDATNLETIEIKSFKISLNLRWQSKLAKQSVINIINAAAANVTYTLHSTVYNKCKSGGEWYTDIQAAIDAKAQQGYIVTLISA